jgi:hypothetical protein
VTEVTEVTSETTEEAVTKTVAGETNTTVETENRERIDRASPGGSRVVVAVM